VDFELIWTEPAVTDLEAVIRYVSARSPVAAEALRLEILNSVEVLVRFPWIGPAYEHDPAGRAREIACGSYRIFYRVQDSQRRIEILSVWHGSRHEPNLPR